MVVEFPGDEDSDSDHDLVSEEDLLRDDPPAVEVPRRSFVPRPGTLIRGKYLVERVHRAGAHGLTLEAEHVDLERRVVLKIHSPLSLRALGLARSLARLQSEHLARVIDYGSLDSGASYIVHEHLSGCDLGGVLLVRERLPVTEAVDYVVQACSALASAQAAGLFHGNLKLSNLFLAREGDGQAQLKVLDFVNADSGLVAWPPNQKSQAGLHSFRYLAPEQVRGSDLIDGRADVWALGAILHELLTGVPAFDAASAPGLCATIAADEPQPIRELRPELPVELETVVLRCLEKPRAARPPDALALAEELEEFASAAVQLRLEQLKASSARQKLRGLGRRSSVAPEIMPRLVAERPVLRDVPRDTSGPRWLHVGAFALGLLGCAACVGTYVSLRNLRVALAARASEPALFASLSPALTAAQPTSPNASSQPTDPAPLVSAGPPSNAIARSAGAAHVAPPKRGTPTPYDDDFTEPDVVAVAKPGPPATPAPKLFDEAN